MERVRREELEQKYPKVIDRLKKLSPKSLSSNNRIYTDTENEFSINTDETYIVKDTKGTITYTFKIERKSEKDEGSLENLILKDLGDGNFFAYFIKYDAVALSNSREKPLSTEELTHHISLYAVGKKTSSEIFGKLDSCPMVFYPVGSYVYVPGQPCGGIEHHAYGQPCPHAGTALAATPGGYQVIYSITMQESGGGCGVGGFEPSSGSGTIGTTPTHGGGGGWNGTFIDVTDPCNILKNDLLLAKQIINKTNIKAQNNAMTATIVNDDNEKGFSFGKDSNGVYQVSSVIELGVNGGSIPLTGLGFVAEGDFHNHNGPTAPPCPSPPDMYDMFTAHVALPSYFIRFVNGSDGSMYALTINSESNMDQFIQDHPKDTSVDLYHPTNNPNGNNFWKDNSDIHEDFMKVAQYFVNKDETQSNAYAYGMAYITQKYNMGMVISQKDSSGNFRPLGIKSKKNQLNPEIDEFEVVHPCNL
ncbi:hypothetical protein GCM10022217_19490 [Chryseobacterium ginsenosidimutans]